MSQFDWNGLGMAGATAGINMGIGLLSNAITGNNYQETLNANVNASNEGEKLEDKIERFVNNKETITDQGSPKIYMERSEGINKAYNFRTDRFEVAIEAMDKVAKSYAARREERGKVNEELKNSEDTNENSGAGQ